MDHLPTHPFPYFGLLVSRDAAAIKAAVEGKYVKVAPLKNNPTRLHEFKAFMANVELLAAIQLGQLGKYDADLKKVEGIIAKCIPLIDDYVIGLVNPHGNSIHPTQVDKSVEFGEKTLGISGAVTKPHIDQLLRSRGVKITTDKPPAGPIKLPKPVTNIRAEVGEGSVRLTWDLPPDDCERVRIIRTDGATHKVSDRGDDVAGKQHLDSKIEAGREYTYGVFSILGSETLMCEVVKVRARGLVKDFKATSGGSRAMLSWTNPPNTQNVRVLRSKTAMTDLVDNRAKPVIPAGAQEVAELGVVTNYEDATATPGSSYYYAVLARHGTDWYSPSECKPVTISKAPPSPQQFKAELVGTGHVYLSWEPVTGVGAAIYTVSRIEETPGKPRSKPQVLASSTKRPTFDDDNVVPGSSYRYFVVTEANDLVSDPPSAAGPVTATGEVDDLHLASQAGRVELSWKRPPGVVRVEIRRGTERPPMPPTTAGQAMPGVDLFNPPGTSTSFVDTKVMNGQSYGYRVSCVYLGADGKEVVTRGKTDMATPREPPPMVRDLEIHPALAGAVKLSWNNRPGATVRVVRTAASPGYKFGDMHSPADVSALGKSLHGVTRTEVLDPSPDPAEPVYLVFSEDGHASLFCGELRFVEVAGFKARYQCDSVLVEWDCPDGSTAFQLVRTTGGATKSQDIPRPPGQKRMGASFKVSVIGSGDHSFTLRCLTNPNDRTFVAGPGRTAATKVVRQEKVTWKFERQGGGWLSKGTVELVVRGEHNLGRIERLVLVGKPNRVPTSIDDCRHRMEFEPVTDLDGVDRRPAPDWAAKGVKILCRLFAIPADEVAITQPKEADATLG